VRPAGCTHLDQINQMQNTELTELLHKDKH